MATVSLDNQFFYTPNLAADPRPANRGRLVRKGDPSTPILGAPLHPPPLQDVHGAKRGGTGMSWDDAVPILSDGEPDCGDSDNGWCDTTSPPLEVFPAAPNHEARSNFAAGGSMCLVFLPMRWAITLTRPEQASMSILLQVPAVIATPGSFWSPVEPTQTMNRSRPSSSSLLA
jgi:hypothetical protein